MSTRLSLDDKLAAIRRIRDESPSPQHTADLKRFVTDRSNLVVAAAAAIVAERALVELAPQLESVFPHFLTDPLKNDKLCRAKLAVVQALDKLEHPGADIFVTAARHVQMEPAWGPPVDTAATLRAAALFALARVGDPRHLTILVDALVDPQKDVRMAAAQSLVTFEHEGSALVLRLKVRSGDNEPEVLTECLSALLTIDSKEYLPFVSSFLGEDHSPPCEAAVISLGRSRLPDALEILRNCWSRTGSTELREQILLAIATLRHSAAIDFLLEIVGTDSDKDALAALFALKIHNYDARLCERIAAIVKTSGSPRVQAKFERDFRSRE